MAPFTVTSIFNSFKAYKKPFIPTPPEVWRDPLYFVAFGLGSGAMPFAPGTFGTLMAIPFYLLLRSLPLTYYVAFVVLFFAASAWLCEYISRQIKTHDHPGMCIDEFAGFFVTMINAPHGVYWIVFGFLLFRLFDIWKPWPIYILDEKVHGGFGMILDDIVAGLYAMIVIQIVALAT